MNEGLKSFEDKVFNSKSWVYRNKVNLLIAGLILYALFATKGCLNNKAERNSMAEAVKDKDAKITYWKDKAGIEHEISSQINGDLKTIKLLYQNKLDSITKSLKIKEKQVTDYIEIVKETKGKIHSRIDSFVETSVKEIPGKDNYIIQTKYIGTDYNDKWITFNAKIKNGAFDAIYTTRDSITLIGYWAKTGFLHLGKKEYYLDINSANPNSNLLNQKNFKVTDIKQNKVGIGIISGYGANLSNVSKGLKFAPFIGIGVFYKIF